MRPTHLRLPTLVLAAASAIAPPALAAPSPGQPFPAFPARDIAGQAHDSRSLAGRPTMVVVLTDPDAGSAAEHWWNVARERVPGGVRRLTLVSIRIPPLTTPIARQQARSRTPHDEWSQTWLDGNRRMAHTLGLENSTTPYVFALDASGRVIAAAHGAPESSEASGVWRALAHGQQ